MFGVYLNGFWNKAGYNGVGTDPTSEAPKLVGLFPSRAEAEAYVKVLDDEATDDWRGDYEIAHYQSERDRHETKDDPTPDQMDL